MKKALVVVCLALFVSACSSHRVRCDGKLRPINAPAAQMSASASAPAAKAKQP